MRAFLLVLLLGYVSACDATPCSTDMGPDMSIGEVRFIATNCGGTWSMPFTCSPRSGCVCNNPFDKPECRNLGCIICGLPNYPCCERDTNICAVGLACVDPKSDGEPRCVALP